ncbi:MAG: organic hydroperoxide resistance protein [Parvularculaceae bacterium]
MTTYRTKAKAQGGRNGKVTLENSGVWFAMQLPKEFGGSGEGSNPEQLFALGYASCFNSALLFVAGQGKLDVSAASVTADVGITRGDAGFGLDVVLNVAIPGMPKADATALVEAAHQVCPYSKATRGNIPVKLNVV